MTEYSMSSEGTRRDILAEDIERAICRYLGISTDEISLETWSKIARAFAAVIPLTEVNPGATSPREVAYSAAALMSAVSDLVEALAGAVE